MRKIVWVLVLILLLSACDPLDGRAGKGTIFRFVENHQQALERRVAEEDFSGIGFPVREVDVNEDHVEFSCGGAGFGPETAYRGFFYTPADDIYAVWCAPSQGTFIEDGNGWLWQEPDGDNRCYVEHICGHFYYYDASF